jgi:hypothetical protein
MRAQIATSSGRFALIREIPISQDCVVGLGGVPTFSNFNGVVCPTDLKLPIDD